MVLPTDPGISYSTTKAVSAPIVAVVTPPTMAATPPKRMSIEDAIADSPFVLVLTWNSAIQKESAHLSLGLIHRSAWKEVFSEVRPNGVLRSSLPARNS